MEIQEEEFIKDLQLDFNIQLLKFKKYDEIYDKLKIDIKDIKNSNEIKTKFGIISPEKYQIEEILDQIGSYYRTYKVMSKYLGKSAMNEKLKEEIWFLISLVIWKLYY